MSEDRGFEFDWTPVGYADTLDKKDFSNDELYNYIIDVPDDKRHLLKQMLEKRSIEVKALTTYKKKLAEWESEIKETKVNHNEIAKKLLNENSFVLSEGELYMYLDEGFYTASRLQIERKIKEAFPSSTVHLRNEIFQDLVLSVKETELNKENGYINFKNGLFNYRTAKLEPHTPDIFTTNQIAVNWNPSFNTQDEKAKAGMEAIEKMLDMTTCNNNDRKETIFALIGYCMTTSLSIQKSFIFYGETAANGKSTLINLIVDLIGRNNVTTLNFKDLNKNRFASADVKGKLLSIGSEMTDEYLDDVSNFKRFVTGDILDIEEKFKNKQTISPYSKFIFTANKLPIVSDKTDGFYRRLQIIPFEHVFTTEESTAFNYKAVTTQEALEYLACKSVLAFMNVAETHEFANDVESEAYVETYKRNSNNVLLFIHDREYIVDNIVKDNSYEAWYKASLFYANYKEYCKENGFRETGRNKFYYEIERSGLVFIGEWNRYKTYTINWNFFEN